MTEALGFFGLIFLIVHFTLWMGLVFPQMRISTGGGDRILGLVLGIPVIGTGIIIYGWIVGEL